VGGLGIGTIIVLGLIGWALGIDPRILIGGAEILTGGQSRYETPAEPPPSNPSGAPTDQLGEFASAVLGDTEDRWKQIFQNLGKRYAEPKLIIYSGLTRSACGAAQSAMGPFYCPNDQSVYLDTSFFRDLEERFRGCSGKSCQFAQAYVITHEIGHHVQNLLGILPKVQEIQQSRGGPAANQLQVMVELQADCLGHTIRKRSGSSSSQVTSRPLCRQPRRSETIVCKSEHKGASSLMPSPTALLLSVCAGSRRD